MKRFIWIVTGSLLLLALIVGFDDTPIQEHLVPHTTAWPGATSSRDQLSSIGRMTTPRAAHTATLLKDGQVLITGGCVANSCEHRSSIAELYNPASNSFTRVGEMATGRASHSATPLADGRVLIAGGWSPDGVVATAEVFDPTTQAFSRTGSMVTARASHMAVLLQDNRVLIIGGEDGSQEPLASAEVYDPSTGLFTLSGRMHEPRASHVATMLNDGSVLVTGGHSRRQGSVLASAEIFDPATGEFTPTGNMTIVRHKHAAVAMRDGKVLVVGGSDARDWRGTYSSAEVFDPSTGKFSHVADMQGHRFKLRGAVVVLVSGEVLVAGGTEHVEVYDPESKAFRTAGGSVGTALMFAAATRLSAGDVLIAGGYDRQIRPTANAWVYHP